MSGEGVFDQENPLKAVPDPPFKNRAALDELQEGILEVKEYTPDPEKPAVVKMTDDMEAAMALLENELTEMFKKVEPILTPGEITAPQPQEQLTGISPTAKSIATWKDRLTFLAGQVHDVAGRVEL